MDITDIAFNDTETRAEPGTSAEDGDVTVAGTYRYHKRAFVVISTFAIGNEPAFDLSLDGGFDRDWLQWKDVPDALKRHHDRVVAGKAWYAAWNAAFDREAWNNGTADFPPLEPEMMIDIMAQATASNLPPSLEGASRAIGRGGKQNDGKALIKLFAPADGGTPQSHPEEWKRYKSYAVRDTAELREVFRHTRPLPLEEWQEYWASERINRRGVRVDLDYCERAHAVATADKARSNRLIAGYTNGKITKVTQSKRIADWLWDNLEFSEARDILTKETVEDPESEDDFLVSKLSVTRDRVERLIAYLKSKPRRSNTEEIALAILELREFGASAAPLKFRTILQQHDEGFLRGQYVFNGAKQTGRFSAKGVQVHNLTRQAIGSRAIEETAIEMLNDLEV